MRRLRRWFLGSLIAIVALLGFYEWLTFDADDACLREYAATMFHEPPPLIDVAPPGCHPVAMALPDKYRWRFPRSIPTRDIAICESDLTNDDVWALYIPETRRMKVEGTRGWERIFVGERFDGFRLGRRTIYLIWFTNASGGTLVATATTVLSPWAYLRSALSRCDLTRG
jgi:hypothetical protein